MKTVDLLVVGGGPAGVSAAVAGARAGLAVALAEQRPALGGALFVAPAEGSAPVRLPSRETAAWTTLREAFGRLAIGFLGEHGFAGIDADGIAILEDRAAGRIVPVRARGVIVAVGAVERVRPRPGAHLPRVVTVGGLQVMMKQSGALPPGRIVVAGSGPLLVAAAAQMAALGRQPLAVLEAGDPFRAVGAAAALAAHPDYALSAGAYLAGLARARVPWRRRHRVVSIESRGEHLSLAIAGPRGETRLETDWLALHDGLRPNDFGLPAEGDGTPVVLRAGDCRQVLGGMAAIADGTRAGLAMVAALRGQTPAPATGETARHGRAQAVLARLFAAPETDLSALPDETVLCRCEGRTIGDLKALLAEQNDALSPREVKLIGRFAMGACQGRFCAEWTARLLARQGAPVPPARAITGQRWPVRPLPIGSFLTRDESEAE